jgi:tRNA-2-methylthio-N6-dimethylallyladenosine synthase
MFLDDVAEDVKRRRNNELLDLQNEISEADNQEFLGREVEVLIEGPSKAAEKRGDSGPQLQLTGRTPCDRIVVFEGNDRQIGQILPILIYDANAHTLFGQVVTEHVGPEVFSLAGPSSGSG